jgi:hypothetical protein
MVLQLFLTRIIGLPVWWYGRGLKVFVVRLSEAVTELARGLSLRVWMKNLFVPMYGDTSFAGRAISFCVRFIMVFVRGVGVVAYTIFLFCVFVVYLILPPAVVIGFIYHLPSLF